MNSMSLQNAQQKPARRARQSHRNTEGIKKFSEQKTLLAFQKAEAAIDRLVQEKETVNFNTVSIEAGVSKPFYTHIQSLDIESKVFAGRRKSRRKRGHCIRA